VRITNDEQSVLCRGYGGLLWSPPGSIISAMNCSKSQLDLQQYLDEAVSEENRSKSQLDLQQYLDEAVFEENRAKPSQLASQAQDKGFLFIKL
jgi:hypothetical protein